MKKPSNPSSGSFQPLKWLLSTLLFQSFLHFGKVEGNEKPEIILSEGK